MKILKFGGTSVGNAERIRKLLDIILPSGRQVIVLSAVAGTTNRLAEIAGFYMQGDAGAARSVLKTLRSQYQDLIRELFQTREGHRNAEELINHHFDLIASLESHHFSQAEEKIILAQGELISTTLFHFYLTELGIRSKLLPALDIVRIDEDGEPVMDAIRTEAHRFLLDFADHQLFITQGYICRNAYGEVDNLRRGGSDYTASLLGAALHADEIQIWTDIDGMHNNDPRVVEGTRPLAALSFEEAAELAYFGAKVLHPHSIYPAKKFNVPVRVLSTLAPEAPGTLISGTIAQKDDVRAVAAKDGITMIRIRSSRMLLSYGFMAKVFEIFARYKTPVDMIATSEVAVSLTIDDLQHWPEIERELCVFSRVDVDSDQTIICVVGNFGEKKQQYTARILEAICLLPVRMLAYGGSDHNISLVVHSSHKEEALRSLHLSLF